MMLGPCICRYADLADFGRAADATWLTPRERRLCAGLRDPRRRQTWCAGRIVAKRLFQELLSQAPLSRSTGEGQGVRVERIEIESGDPRGRRSRPRAVGAGQTLPWSLSIAHTGRGVLVALADQGTTSVGVDLVEPVRLGRGFVAQWFTPAERRWLHSDDFAAVAWAVKEAVYKATNRGEPFRPQSVEVFPSPDGSLLGRNVATGQVVRHIHIWKTRHGETAVLAWVSHLSPDPCSLIADP